MNAYEAACHYFENAANQMDLSRNIRTLMLTPEREVKVQVALQMDNGEVAHVCWLQNATRQRAGADEGGASIPP